MFSKLLGRMFGAAPSKEVRSPFDSDQLMPLDAEDLAEQGIARAYQQIHRVLSTYVASPLAVSDVLDEEKGAYAVRVGTEVHPVYSPDLPGTEQESWGRATCLFFRIVNDQLSSTRVRMYAVYAGNDLGCIFLTPKDAEAARARIPRREDWPYLPAMEPPWYGQPH